MKKAIFVFLIFFLSCARLEDYPHIRVIKVIDGDTVKLADGKLLRYIGIDTPEIRIKNKSGFIYAPQPYALEAKRLNKSLVEGKFIRVEFDLEKTDIYGRLLGYCFAGDTFVNAKILEEGFAVLCTIPPNVKYADTFVQLQKKARQDKRGLWGAYEVIEYSRAASYVNQIRTVRGKVAAARKTKRCVRLIFGSERKNNFSVVIFNNSLPYFYNKDIDPLNFYRDKTIEVSGRIRQYHGPEIIANSPADIQIADEK